MGTPFSEVYEAALSRFWDEDFLKLSDFAKQETMYGYLCSAERDFAPYCLTSLKHDQPAAEYRAELESDEIQVLACGLSYYWLSSQVLSSKHLRNKFSSKDIQYYSPAYLLKEMTTLRENAKKEFHNSIVQYTYEHGNIVEMKVGKA